MSKLAQDLQLNWNKDKYSIKYFRPPETFGGEEIDPKTNRDIQREQLECGNLPEIKNLVEFFESANHIYIKRVWLIQKSRNIVAFKHGIETSF